MQPWQRETLILGLAASSGAVDGWSYFGLAHTFIANMTGNTVLLGYFAATGASSHKAIGAALAISCYACGVFLGALLSRPVRRAARESPPDLGLWPARVNAVLTVELILLVMAAMLDSYYRVAVDSWPARLLVGLGAVAVGLQSAVMLAMQLPGIVTTYITGTWTTLCSGIAQLIDGEQRGYKRHEWEKRLLLQGLVLAAYCGGAALAGVGSRDGSRALMGWIAPAFIATVLAAATMWRRPAAQPATSA